ncbi:MAG: hypothetical protein A4E57_03100 [Syntrophorhabdaceae bacterium PtaU1.Bin034]|jgi:putative salt-induced outer membrane protein YdiY|nr:MAG: hypothetical protein A4E57_03100 [Syntrophorhabdaceae bacterium PtaU1.Bin034]
MKIRSLGRSVVFHILAITVLWFAFTAACIAVDADNRIRVHFSNGDRISGIIVGEEEDHFVLRNDSLGDVKINKASVEKLEGAAESEIAEPVKKEPKLWKTELALGFNLSEGNTVTSSFSGYFHSSRKTDSDEFTIKGSYSYGSAERRMDDQKWYGMIRYAFSFRERKWYNFYRFEGDHDRFANIDYRLLPSTGIGYWFFDKPGLRAMAELAIGLENTHFRDNTPGATETVLIPRIFLEKRLLANTVFFQDITLYPSLSYFGDYRLRWETSVKNDLTDRLFLRFSFIDNYNSSPGSIDTKRNDMQFITSLGYTY